MAILESGNAEVEVRFHKYYSCGWIEYSFEPRVAGLPLINPAVNNEKCKEGKYLCCNVFDEDYLIPFFESLLKEKQDDEWNQWPDTKVTIKAETWQSRREQRRKEWEGKTVLLEDFDGKVKREPRAKAMELFEPLFETFLNLYIIFDREFFIGQIDFISVYDVCLKLHLSFTAVEAFLGELKAEYEVFKLMMEG